MKKKNKLNVNKASLVEATMLAMTGKLILEEEKEVITEDVQVETSDVEVVVGEDTTIIESDEATIIVQEAEIESSEEEEETPEVVEVPVEGDETIIPEEVVEELPEEIPAVEEIVDEEPIITDEVIEEVSEETEEEVVEESVTLEEELTSEKFPDQGTYWNGDGRYQEDVELLNKLIPDQGTEPAIEGVLPKKVVAEYITLSNKYYRWFNDGDVPFKKLADGTVIYPSYTRGEKSKTVLGQRTVNSIAFDLEKRVNALIEKINDEYPDWREKLNITDETAEEVVEEPVQESLQESKEIVEEDYSQKLGGEPADFVNDVKALLRELKTIETENFATQLAKEMVYEFEETCESQIRMITARYNLEESLEVKEEAIEEGNTVFELKMDCSNEEAFGEGEELNNTVAEKIHEVAENVEAGRDEGSIMDINGNKVGQYGFGFEGVVSALDEEKEECTDPECEKIEEATEVIEEAKEVVEESTEVEEEITEEVIEESKEIVEEAVAPKAKFNADSFQTIVENFYKETYKTFENFKLSRVLKNESNIRIYGQLSNTLGNTKNICLEGKVLQAGKSFTKYSINECTSLKLESVDSTRLSMMTFTNKDNVLECKYLKHSAKKLEK